MDRKRKRQVFKTLQEAKDKAAIKATQMTNGDLGAVSLSQAVDFYLKRHPVHMEPKLVRTVVDELLKLKESEQLSTRYRKQLAYDLNRFAARFRGRLGDVAGTDIDEWLRDLKVGPRTRNHLRNSVQALFNFAISRSYLPMWNANRWRPT